MNSRQDEHKVNSRERSQAREKSRRTQEKSRWSQDELKRSQDQPKMNSRERRQARKRSKINSQEKLRCTQDELNQEREISHARELNNGRPLPLVCELSVSCAHVAAQCWVISDDLSMNIRSLKEHPMIFHQHQMISNDVVENANFGEHFSPRLVFWVQFAALKFAFVWNFPKVQKIKHLID